MRSRLALIATAVVLALGLLFVTPTASAQCGPSARGIFPASGIVGDTVNATVTGTSLTGATAQVFGESGLTVTVQNASDLSVSLQLQIDAAAAPGERVIALTTPGGSAFVGFTVNPAGGPIVSTVSPTPIATRGFALDLSFTGQNLAGIDSSQVSVSGSGVTVTNVVADVGGALLDVSLAVASDADLGTHAIVIQTPSGGAVLQVYVQRPAPTVTGVFPAAGEIGATVPITITGENLTAAALVITSGAGAAGGVAITDVATPDEFTLTALLHIDPALSPESEPRLLIVTTESGQSTAEFFVVEADVPSLTGLRPGAGEPGQIVSVELRGLNLTGATVSTLSSAISLQNVVPVDDETITLDVVVSAGATPDTDHAIRVTSGTDTATITFRVIGVGDPFIGAVRPPFGNRGDTLALFLQGVNLTTVVPGSGIDISGPKITESNATALDDRTARATLDLDPTASIGLRDVTVTTSGGSFTKSASFRVNIPGQIPVISDVMPLALEPGTATAINVTGSGFTGAGVTVGGPGATVTDTLVDVTGTTITFVLTLADDAPAESRPVIVVTENGTATCSVRSLPPEIELSAATLLRTGSSFEVTGGGYRLFLFEFSINERFDSGLRTFAVSSGGPALTLTRLQAENVGRAVRDLPFGYVRVRAVTATSQLGTSGVIRFRR